MFDMAIFILHLSHMSRKQRLLNCLVGLFVVVHISTAVIFGFREGLDWWDALLVIACVGCWFGTFWAGDLIDQERRKFEESLRNSTKRA